MNGVPTGYADNEKRPLAAAFLVIRETTAQRCRALKRGLLLQITNTLPRRRTTLQSRCRVLADFRDESTFTADSLDEPGGNKARKCSVGSDLPQA